jgi:hypothetical protein
MPTAWRPLILVLLAFTAVLAASQARPQPGSLDLRERMSVAEFQRCGLHKLTAAELAALGSWIGRQTASSAPQTLTDLPTQRGRPAVVGSEMVAFNTSSRKYHCPSCRWALRCTRNCISIPLSQASQRGVPCASCGGRCR